MPQQQPQRTSKSPRPNNSPRPNRAAPTSAQGNALGKRGQTNTHKCHRPSRAAPMSAQGNALGKRRPNKHSQIPKAQQGRHHASPGQRPGKTPPNKHSQIPQAQRATPTPAQGNALGKRRQTNTHKFHRPNGPPPRQPRATPWVNDGQTKDPSPQRGGLNAIAPHITKRHVDPPRWGSAVDGPAPNPRALPWAGLPLPTSGRETDRSPTDPRPVPDRSPTDPRPIPDRFPTDSRPIPDRFPTDSRPIPDRTTRSGKTVRPTNNRVRRDRWQNQSLAFSCNALVPASKVAMIFSTS